MPLFALKASVLLVVVLAAACGGSEGGGTPLQKTTVSIGLSDAGCSPRDVTVPAGKVTFQVGNPNSSVVQTFEVRQANELLGRVTNIVGGLSRNLEVELEEGTYLIACSGAGKGGSGTLTVTGLER